MRANLSMPNFIAKFETYVLSFFLEVFLHYCSVISELERDDKKLILTKDFNNNRMYMKDDAVEISRGSNPIPRMKIPHRLFARLRVVLLD